MTKITKINETGRSMVEMLGVLAVIGVLSIGGVVAYRIAMNRYRANEIMNLASITSSAAISANGGEGVPEAYSFQDLVPNTTKPVGLSSLTADRWGQVRLSFLEGYGDTVGALIDQMAGQRRLSQCTCAESERDEMDEGTFNARLEMARNHHVTCLLNMGELRRDPEARVYCGAAADP